MFLFGAVVYKYVLIFCQFQKSYVLLRLLSSAYFLMKIGMDGGVLKSDSCIQLPVFSLTYLFWPILNNFAKNKREKKMKMYKNLRENDTERVQTT